MHCNGNRIGISDATARRLRDRLRVWERERHQAGFHTATAWIEHELPAAEVERCGAAVAARAVNREGLCDSITCWKWITAEGDDLDSHTEAEQEASDQFWRSLGAMYDEHFGWGFLMAIEDAYERMAGSTPHGRERA